MVRAKTLVDPPGRGARAVSVPARPLAASLSVPSPPMATTTSTPSLAAPWARRVAWPRRLVSETVRSWSAARALAMTTRARAVTDDAEAFTTRTTLIGLLLVGRGAELGQAAGQKAGHVHLADAEALGDLRLRGP